MPDLAGIVADLKAEVVELDGVVGILSDEQWDLPTPAEGWSIRDQISHLAFFDEQARHAATDPDGFAASLQNVALDVGGFMDEPIDRGRALAPNGVLQWWRSAGAQELAAFAGLAPSTRIPWFGPPMSPASFVSARIMETWAHGQDIYDALQLSRTPTARLRHICHLGVRARANSYGARGRSMPDVDVAVVLVGPGGEMWAWNEGAEHRIAGSALDFCLVVTQRRHPDDTSLMVEGPAAREWLEIAQAFAGPPGNGRKSGQFAPIGL
ncbi:MAG: TIGR03084 family metal-binding protein [Actinomycetota bacterium]